MGKWTRRDLVKTGLAASAGVMTGGELLAEPRLAGTAAFAQAAGSLAPDQAGNLRERLLLDYGWRFALGNANDPDKDFGFGKLRGTGTFAKSGDPGGPAGPRFDDSAWRKLDVPHDWAVELPFVNDKILVGHGAKPVAREFPEDPASAGTVVSLFFQPRTRASVSPLSSTAYSATRPSSSTATTWSPT